MKPNNPLIICAFIVLAACSSGKKHTPLPEPSASGAQVLHNARQSTHWQGTYQGILPCANCEGIATMLILEPDGHYTLRTRQLGIENKDHKYEGRYDWHSDSQLRLSGDSQQKIFTVYDGYLEAAMPDGSPIPAHPGANYRLERTQ